MPVDQSGAAPRSLSTGGPANAALPSDRRRRRCCTYHERLSLCSFVAPAAPISCSVKRPSLRINSACLFHHSLNQSGKPRAGLPPPVPAAQKGMRKTLGIICELSSQMGRPWQADGSAIFSHATSTSCKDYTTAQDWWCYGASTGWVAYVLVHSLAFSRWK